MEKQLNITQEDVGVLEGMSQHEVFERRASVKRTPPKELMYVDSAQNTDDEVFQTKEQEIDPSPRDRAHSLQSDNIKYIIGTSKQMKRSRQESEEEIEREVFRKSLQKLKKTIADLVEVTETSTKTKTEIKNLVQKLKRQAKDVNNEWETIDKELEINKAKRPSKEMKSVGIQVELEEIKSEYEKKKIEKIGRIKTILSEQEDFKSLEEILEEKWPQEMYIKTKIDGTIQSLNEREGDYVILANPNNMEKNKIFERLQEKYEGLSELIKVNDGQIDYLIQSAKTRTSKGEKEEISGAVYFLPMKVDPHGECETEELFNKLRELLIETTKVHPTSNINIVIGEDMKVSTIRKMCEFIARGQSIEIKILTQGLRSDPQKQRKIKEETLVMIKSGESSYADLLKKMKEEVDIGKIGVKINRIRKTGNGDIMLAVEGGQDRANTLEMEIKTKIENANVTTKKTGTTTLYIIGMDQTTQESELIQAIVRETNIKEAEIDIKVIRKGKYGDQTAIIEVPRLPAAVLIRERKLKVGWIECGVRERIHVVRCFKCLEHGHKTYECISTKNRAEECIKCGQTGHKSKDCKNAERCIKCEVEGHRADQIRCPYFKELVEKIRQERINLTSTNRGGGRRTT